MNLKKYMEVYVGGLEEGERGNGVIMFWIQKKNSFTGWIFSYYIKTNSKSNTKTQLYLHMDTQVTGAS